MAKERILVVDDGRDMREFVIDYVLKPNGFEWAEAQDGLEAYEALRAQLPDLMLLDLQMPRLDGMGLLKRMRDEAILVPVVLMTFYGSEEIATEVFRLGVRDYVIKPFTDDEMLEAIERALQLSRTQQERDMFRDRLIAANDSLEQRIQSLNALCRLGQQLVTAPNIDGILSMTLNEVSAALRPLAASVVLREAPAHKLVTRGYIDNAGSPQLVYSPLKSSFAQQALDEGRQIVGAPARDSQGNMVLQVATPFSVGGQVLGVMLLQARQDMLAQHHLMVLEAFANYMAMGLEQARHFHNQA
ncbi:MAG: response regulator [Chloroflexi bacterium]|nr:response regulator [Chloroflexota bacterium]